MLNSIKSSDTNLSRLGHIIVDIQCLVASLQWAKVTMVKRDANFVAHSLVRYAKNLSNDVIWLEDSLPLALEALYYDSFQFQ